MLFLLSLLSAFLFFIYLQDSLIEKAFGIMSFERKIHLAEDSILAVMRNALAEKAFSESVTYHPNTHLRSRPTAHQ
jgi:hypothetical protein